MNHAATHHPHPLPLHLLAGVFLALLIFTFLTVAATWIDLGPWNIVLALGIAFIKATLVGLYFMHLRYDHPFNALVLLCSLAFVALMISVILIDAVGYQVNLQAATGQATINSLP